ncbi:hypothetical protein M231_05435 [Tremella mesenterica]|uniref:Xylose isomerase-like TIM barrel domain-containing protein n=1 Tax=Tremella mesenterica TaxID=5217 RepID=A0A4Q1BI32_TREME|nr:hypothetical protein M231_05435 [Tremella mesenterica]
MTGTVIGTSFAELRYVRDLIKDRSRLKFCVDLCHVHVRNYDLSSDSGLARFFADMKDVLGAENVVCVHVSEAVHAYGTGKDVHSRIGSGTIGVDSLRHIMRHSSLSHVGFILETPRLYRKHTSSKIERAEVRRLKEELEYVTLLASLSDRHWEAMKDDLIRDHEKRWKSLSAVYAKLRPHPRGHNNSPNKRKNLETKGWQMEIKQESPTPKREDLARNMDCHLGQRSRRSERLVTMNIKEEDKSRVGLVFSQKPP